MVSELFKLEKEYITGIRRQQDRVRARDVLCYWAARDLGIPMVDIANKLDMSLAAISCAVKREEKQ